MRFNLPGLNLYYLLRENFKSEMYESMTRLSATWNHIKNEYKFDERYRDHYYAEG